MRKKIFIQWFSVAFFLVTSCLNAQSPPPSDVEVADDTDPTKAVFFTAREEYYNLFDDNYRNALIFRADRTILNESNMLKPKGIILRGEIPMATTHISGKTVTGLGDCYLQGLFFPRLKPGFVIAAGTGFLFPTATDSQIGQGKWQVAPLIVPVWFFPQAKGFFLTKVQNFFSYAGEESRPDVNYLLITPTFLWRTTRKNWILIDEESKINWELDQRVSNKFGIEFGRLFNAKIGFWVKPEIPFGPNREGDFNFKFTFILKK